MIEEDFNEKIEEYLKDNLRVKLFTEDCDEGSIMITVRLYLGKDMLYEDYDYVHFK